jgi:hypothetical protein
MERMRSPAIPTVSVVSDMLPPCLILTANLADQGKRDVKPDRAKWAGHLEGWAPSRLLTDVSGPRAPAAASRAG